MKSNSVRRGSDRRRAARIANRLGDVAAEDVVVTGYDRARAERAAASSIASRNESHPSVSLIGSALTS